MMLLSNINGLSIALSKIKISSRAEKIKTKVPCASKPTYRFFPKYFDIRAFHKIDSTTDDLEDIKSISKLLLGSF